MAELSNNELEVMGYKKVYDYTQYSHDEHINVIPRDDFKHLVHDTFRALSDVMKETYGPYGSIGMISDMSSQTYTTKDGFNVFSRLNFSHQYKTLIYRAIYKICDRVNRNVGDGTTSCILLARKIFDAIEAIAKTVDDERQLMDALNKIQKNLESIQALEADKESQIVKPLSRNDFSKIIRMASNGDDDMTEVLTAAFDAEYNENDEVISVRNVVADEEHSTSADSNATYSLDFLPGDFRIRVNIETELGLALQEPTTMKVAVYDHAFGNTDWKNFIQNFDTEELTLILARSFSATFMDSDYVRYCRQRAMVKMPIKIYLCEVKGTDIKNNIKDLCAVLNVKPYKLSDCYAIDHAELPDVKLSVYKGNCMCFYDVKAPEKYIELLKQEMKDDASKSLVRKLEFQDRLDSLDMTSKDSLVTVMASSTMESAMLMDKIDDCTSIVRSAIANGVVPNMLWYGYNRVKSISMDTEIGKKLVDAILSSIEGLFEIIWNSKYSYDNEEANKRFNETREMFYNKSKEQSYDIVHESFVPYSDLPTSAQYDLEVIDAAISILKYLLTSRFLVFDAHLQTQHGDIGHFEV